MVEQECKVVLNNETYYPGQIINGKVEINFESETKVRAIQVTFKGRAKVIWQTGRNQAYSTKENYFELVSDLLLCETDIPRGHHAYPFTFTLPTTLPSTVTHETGTIRYTVQATVDRPWATDYKDRTEFKVCSYIDLNYNDDAKKPIQFTKTKRPFSIFSERGGITISVQLPATGYVPSQMVDFTAQLKNDSNINVQEVRFKLVQGFTFHQEARDKSEDAVEGQEFAIIGSSVLSGYEKSWDLELRIPPDMFNGNIDTCTIIKSFVELRGEVVLPIPHKNLSITIPLILGNVPLQNLASRS